MSLFYRLEHVFLSTENGILYRKDDTKLQSLLKDDHGAPILHDFQTMHQIIESFILDKLFTQLATQNPSDVALLTQKLAHIDHLAQNVRIEDMKQHLTYLDECAKAIALNSLAVAYDHRTILNLERQYLNSKIKHLSANVSSIVKNLKSEARYYLDEANKQISALQLEKRCLHQEIGILNARIFELSSPHMKVEKVEKTQNNESDLQSPPPIAPPMGDIQTIWIKPFNLSEVIKSRESKQLLKQTEPSPVDLVALLKAKMSERGIALLRDNNGNGLDSDDDFD